MKSNGRDQSGIGVRDRISVHRVGLDSSDELLIGEQFSPTGQELRRQVGHGIVLDGETLGGNR
jgi:hypothetical protein